MSFNSGACSDQKLFFFILFTSVVFFARGSCPSGWSTSPSGHCYQFLDIITGFHGCLKKCQDRNATLACVRSDADNAFLIKLLIFDGDSRGPAFIGLTNQLKEGSWQWVGTSCTSTFFSWANAEHGGTQYPMKEDCATMPPWHDLSNPSDWDYEDCLCSRGCICEHGLSTRDEYRPSESSSADESYIECQTDSQGLRLTITVFCILCICCGTAFGICLCYCFECCCWAKPTHCVSPQASPHQDGDVLIVIGQPVEGHVIQVQAKSPTEVN